MLQSPSCPHHGLSKLKKLVRQPGCRPTISKPSIVAGRIDHHRISFIYFKIEFIDMQRLGVAAWSSRSNKLSNQLKWMPNIDVPRKGQDHCLSLFWCFFKHNNHHPPIKHHIVTSANADLGMQLHLTSRQDEYTYDLWTSWTIFHLNHGVIYTIEALDGQVRKCH